MTTTLTLHCPAKINLGLHILGKRSDGYHELDSIMLRLDDVADILTITPLEDTHEHSNEKGDAGAIHLTVKQAEGTEPLPIEGNLVYRAAQDYLAAWSHYHAQPAPSIRIHLEKHIPIAAGLGGGSSDAASTLKGLAQLFPAEIDVHALALHLGSDIPFFLHDSLAARMQGRGELLEPLDLALEGWYLALINPSIAVSAGEAYSFVQHVDDALPLHAIRQALQTGEKVPLHNGLQSGILARYQGIAEVIALLKQACDTVLMSGSGSTCFALSREPLSLADTGDYWVRQLAL